MRVYPLDFSIKDRQIQIHCYTGEGRVTLSDEFLNYFFTYPRIPQTHVDSRIERIENVTREYYGEVLEVSQIFVKKHYDTKELALGLMSQYKLKHALEADVPIIRKYLYDRNIEPLKGYDVSGIGDGAFATRKATGEFISFEQLCVIGFDIETYASTKHIDSKQNAILMIALYVSQNNKVRKYVFSYGRKSSGIEYAEMLTDERSMLVRFNDLLKSLKPDIICGYNSDNFDWPYIADRCEKYGIRLDFGFNGTGLTFSGGTQKSVYLTGSPHVDICNFIRVNMRGQLKTTSYTLDAVSSEILGEKKIEVSISQMYKAWDAQDADVLDKFIEYNLHDSYLCVKLLEKLFANILEFVGMIRLPVEDATRMSYSQLVESYLMNRTRDGLVLENKLPVLMIPPRPTRDESEERMALPPNVGAFVFKPTPGLYEHIVVCDFRSLYPSIIASLNIERSSMSKTGMQMDRVPEFDGELYFSKPPHAPKAFIPRVIEDIILRRVAIKDLVKAATDAREKLLLEARSYNLKILANAMYGYLSFAQGRWYCEECGGATTAYARHYIKYTIKKAQDAGFNVIYSDTDSLFIELRGKSTDEAKAFVKQLNSTLPGIMQLQFEDEFASGIFVGAKGGTGGAKKRYALLSTKGKFKITGFEYVRNDWCDFARETQYSVISMLLKEKDQKKAFAYAKDRIKELIDKKVPLSQLIMRDKLSRDVSEYTTNLPHVIIARRMQESGEAVGRGKTISYVVTAGKGPIYERVVVPELATQENVDVDYYVNNQVIPVIESIFNVFGYKKEDFELQKNQTGLSQFF